MKKLKGFWEGVADAFSFITTIIVLVMIAIMLSACSSLPPDYPTRSRSDVVAELNRYRIDRGLVAITTNPKMEDLAAARASNAWPYRNKDLRLGHSGFNSDVNRVRPPGRWFGENLYTAPFSPTAKESIWAWHNSESHRRMMSRPSMDDCSAAETYDGRQSVIALICADRKSELWL
jgi:uncharacterized protein YkwD